MLKKTILVIFGGSGMEYYAGCKVYSETIGAINKNLFNIVKIGITPDGKWLLTDAEPSEIRDGKSWIYRKGNKPAFIMPEERKQKIIILENESFKTLHIDVAFPLIAGYGGEDGRIQGMLDMAGIPYVGSGMISSAICLDKELTGIFANLCGLKTPKNKVLHKRYYDTNMVGIEPQMGFDYPVFIKPANGGTSVGITRALNKEELLTGIKEAFMYDDKILLEEQISGTEIKVAVIGNEILDFGELCEIEMPEGAINDYETKQTSISKKTIPADLDEEIVNEIKKQSNIIYKMLNCRGLARIDFFLTKDKEIYFNEINTIPGLGRKSIYSLMFKEKGISFEDLVMKLIDTAKM